MDTLFFMNSVMSLLMMFFLKNVFFSEGLHPSLTYNAPACVALWQAGFQACLLGL